MLGLTLSLALPLSLLHHSTPPENSTIVSRTRVKGRVRNLAAQPWANAKVVLISSIFPDSWATGDIDRIETRCDEQGRFSAMLLRGQAYFAWAYELEEAGRYRITNLAAHVQIGSPAILTEARRKRVRYRIRLTGNISWWKPFGGVNVMLVAKLTPNDDRIMLRHSVALELNDKNEFILPPIPCEHAEVLVFSGQGILIERKRFECLDGFLTPKIKFFGKDSNKATDVKSVLHDYARLKVSAAYPMRIAVRQDNKAVANARLFMQVEQQLNQVGSSDSKGIAIVAFPWDGKSHLRMIRSGALGLGMNLTKWKINFEKNRDVAEYLASDAIDQSITLIGHRLSGRIMLRDGQAAKNMQILLTQSSSPKSAVLHRTDEQGRFVLDNVSAGDRIIVCALLGSKAKTSLQQEGQALLSSFAYFGWFAMLDKDTDLGLLDLSSLSRTHIKVKKYGGERASTCTVEIPNLLYLFNKLQMSSDRRGELTLLHHQGAELTVLAEWSDGYAQGQIGAETKGSLKLQGTEPLTIFGQVRDFDGEPFPGIRLTAMSRTSGLQRVFLNDEHGKFHVTLPQSGRWTFFGHDSAGQLLRSSYTWHSLTDKLGNELILSFGKRRN